MSRGRQRARRKSRTIAAGKKLKTSLGESSQSRSYETGKTFGYNYRVKGPTSPVTVTKMDPEEM